MKNSRIVVYSLIDLNLTFTDKGETKMRKTVATTKAPAAIGPYAQANIIDNLVFTSGQLGLIPETGELAEGLEAHANAIRLRKLK